MQWRAAGRETWVAVACVAATAASGVLALALAALLLGNLVVRQGRDVRAAMEDLLNAEQPRLVSERELRFTRVYLQGISASPVTALEDARATRRQAHALLEALHGGPPSHQDAEDLARLRALRADYEVAADALVRERDALGGGGPRMAAAVRARLAPRFQALEAALAQFATEHRAFLMATEAHAREEVRRGVRQVAFAAGVSLVLSTVMGVLLLRVLGRLQRKRRALEARNDDLDAFAGRVAHDLRNVLQPGRVALAALERQLPDAPPPIAAKLQALGRASARADGLIDSLLAFARAGRASPSEEGAAVRPVLDGVLEEVESHVERLGVEVEVEVDDPAAGPLTVACAPGMLHMVLGNLVGNAVKYLEGSPRRHLKVCATRVLGGRVLLEVADSGPGIPADALPHIFEPFYRVKGTRPGGLGIGLATVHRVVEAHGGRLKVDSTPGRGSCFRVWLPAAPPPADTQAPTRHDAPSDDAPTLH